MLIELVEVMLSCATVYAVMGVLFAAAFHWIGLRRVNPAGASAGWFFRGLITPGIIALWPVLLIQWMRAMGRCGGPAASVEREGDAQLRAWHRRAWWLLAIVIPLLCFVALWFRPAEMPSQKLPPAIARPRRAVRHRWICG
jgi:hypothetical protein